MNPTTSFRLALPILGAALLLMLGFWIWMLVDCLFNETDKSEARFKWALGICLGNVIGATIYLFVRKLPRKKLITKG